MGKCFRCEASKTRLELSWIKTSCSIEASIHHLAIMRLSADFITDIVHVTSWHYERVTFNFYSIVINLFFKQHHYQRKILLMECRVFPFEHSNESNHMHDLNWGK